MDLFAYLRKFAASVTLTAMMATFFATPLAQAASSVEDFTDAAEIPTWADEAIEELMDMGVIAGNDDGSFAPNRQLNRAEVSKVIVLSTGVDFDTTGGPHFPEDVMESDWYYDYVETMYNYGWVNGYPDGLFRPGVGINRAELAKMVLNAFEIDQDLSGAPHFDDVDESDWFYGYVETAYNYGLMRGYGDGSFGPGDAVTRAQTVKIVYDSLLVISQPVGPAEGTLEVVLSPDTPRGTNIPFNATSVPFTTVELTASDDSDVEVSSLTFTRLGLGDNDDFDNVWLEVDGFKVGNDKSVNNDDVVELRFNPPLIVPAGQTIVADVVASLEVGTSSNDDDRANTGHHNRFAVISADDLVTTAANVVGDFPLEGEEMEISDYQVSQLRFSGLGSDSTIDVGDNFIEIGKFRLLNDSNTNKDIEIRALTFKNDGTAELEDGLENVALYVSGEQVSAETIIDGDYVTFRLDNGVTGGYIVEDGDSRIFSMRADIVSAEKDDFINFKIDNFEDLVGVEVGTSFGVKAVSGDSGLSLSTSGTSASTSDYTCTAGSSDAEDNCARLRAYNVDSGDLNVSRDPASLGNQEYAPGSNDVVFMTARVVVDQPMILDGVTVKVAQDSTVADKSSDSDTTADNLSDFNVAFDNFRLFLNDKLVDSENDFKLASGGSDGTVTNYELVFNTTFELAGTSILKLVGNIEDDAASADKIRLTLDAGDFESPEYISTGDQVEDSQLLGSAEASFVEVEESTLIITRTDGLSDDDRIVAGVDDVTFMSFVLDNNDSGDVNTTSVTVGAYATGAAEECSNFTAALFVDGTQQGSAKNLNGTATCDATFNDISVVIPSAGQKEFTVVLDTIEQSADSNPATTTATACVNSTDEVAAIVDTDLIAAPGANANATTINTATAHGLSVGDTVAIGVAGDTAAASVGVQISLVESDTEVRTVATIVDTDTFTISTALSQGHPSDGALGDDDTSGADHGIAQVTTTCDDDAANTITVSDASNIDVGDVLTLTGADTEETGTCTVTAVTGTSIACTMADTATGGTNPSDDLQLPITVAETSASATFRLFISAVDADNVENGQDVTVSENSENLAAASITETNNTGGVDLDANCTDLTPAAVTNYLCGVKFELIDSGQLSIAQETPVYSDVIIAGDSDVEVLRIKFDASDDEIHVEDLYLINDIGLDDTIDTVDKAVEGRVDFKLYNAAGQLLQTKQMINGQIHFELANQDRIRVPKDDVTYVVVKVDARAITEANQTGKRVQLRLGDFVAAATNNPDVEANTAATGADLADTDVEGSVDGNPFVLYATNISVKHASTQPSMSLPSTGAEVYRFTVSADAAGAVDLKTVTIDLTLNGLAFNLVGAFETRPVVNGSLEDNVTFTTTATAGGADNGTSATLEIDLSGQRVSAGGSLTFGVIITSAVDEGATTAENTDGVSVDLKEDAAYAAPAAYGAATGNLVWSDESGSPHNSTTSVDWLNGYLVDIDTTAIVRNKNNN